MNPWLWVGVLAVFAFSVWLGVIIFAVARRSDGKTCGWCQHYFSQGQDELCGYGMGFEPTPFMKTCTRFEKKSKEKI